MGRAVAFAEGNALGKGPQILRLGLDDVAWIRRQAAAGNPVFMQLEVLAYSQSVPIAEAAHYSAWLDPHHQQGSIKRLPSYSLHKTTS